MSEHKDERDFIISTNIKNDDDNNNKNITLWRSCCITTDKNMIIYFSQMTITILILTFSAVMLAQSHYECNRSAPYLSLISFILGKLLSSISTTR